MVPSWMVKTKLLSHHVLVSYWRLDSLAILTNDWGNNSSGMPLVIFSLSALSTAWLLRYSQMWSHEAFLIRALVSECLCSLSLGAAENLTFSLVVEEVECLIEPFRHSPSCFLGGLFHSLQKFISELHFLRTDLMKLPKVWSGDCSSFIVPKMENSSV